MYISTNEELATLCERARSHKVLAVDTEFLRERTYHPKLCLVQLGFGDEVCAVDPLACTDLSPLAKLFCDTSVTKVFHACSQDLEVINHAMGCVPTPIFDTQLAAAFLGHRMQMGYGPLVEAYTGVHLAKTESLTDWSRRPLDASQLEYALDDVRYLPGIYDTMISHLVDLGRLAWVTPELDALCDPSHYTHEPLEAFRHAKRVTSLTRRQLAIAREVCAWRERKAARRDIPRKWVMTDEVAIELSKRAPKTPERLRRIRGTEQISERDAEAICVAIAKGAACSPEQCPKVERHMRPTPDMESVMDLMYALLRHVSESSGIATQIIATRDDLRDFLADPATSKLNEGWRRELVGKVLGELLSGQVGLTVKEGRIELL